MTQLWDLSTSLAGLVPKVLVDFYQCQLVDNLILRCFQLPNLRSDASGMPGSLWPYRAERTRVPPCAFRDHVQAAAPQVLRVPQAARLGFAGACHHAQAWLARRRPADGVPRTRRAVKQDTISGCQRARQERGGYQHRRRCQCSESSRCVGEEEVSVWYVSFIFC